MLISFATLRRPMLDLPFASRSETGEPGSASPTTAARIYKSKPLLYRESSLNQVAKQQIHATSRGDTSL